MTHRRARRRKNLGRRPAAANILEATFSDNITVNLHIHYGGTGGGALPRPIMAFGKLRFVESDLIDECRTRGSHVR